MRGIHTKLGEGIHNKLGEGERKVRLGQDSLPNIHFRSGNERKVGTLFYPHLKNVVFSIKAKDTTFLKSLN